MIGLLTRRFLSFPARNMASWRRLYGRTRLLKQSNRKNARALTKNSTTCPYVNRLTYQRAWGYVFLFLPNNYLLTINYTLVPAHGDATVRVPCFCVHTRSCTYVTATMGLFTVLPLTSTAGARRRGKAVVIGVGDQALDQLKTYI